ncbi:hypothetical protein [Streptococcus dentiloxodontae]
MVFVREVIPEEYWDMLKELGVYNKYTHLIPWIADKDRGIYMWTSRFADREDRTTDHILIWQNQVIDINTESTASIQFPEWDDTHEHLQKGLVKRKVNYIKIPQSLASSGKELIQIIREVFQNSSYRYDVELTYIAMPEVMEDK